MLALYYFLFRDKQYIILDYTFGKDEVNTRKRGGYWKCCMHSQKKLYIKTESNFKPLLDRWTLPPFLMHDSNKGLDGRL